MSAYAVAIDLGTTTIAASLYDISSGARISSASSLNPQRDFGMDVVSRMASAIGSQDVRREMSKLVNSELESISIRLLADEGLSEEHLRMVAIAGNPAMEHLLLDLPVESIARIPYRPLFREGKAIRTTDLGWLIDAAAFVFPLPGGFVGGDLVAFLYGQVANNIDLPLPASRLFLDLGTNAEIALIAGDSIYATSAASGPAFEGGSLACGMAALPGAITEAKLQGEKISLSVIGGGTPLGLCGTGALSVVSMLLAAGVIDCNGRLNSSEEVDSNLGTRLNSAGGEHKFTVYKDAARTICLSQNDIRQIQLAKAAIRAGIELLVRRAGDNFSGQCDLVLTGSFGVAINQDLLVSLGIIPAELIKETTFVSEGVVAGIERFLDDPDREVIISSLLSRLKLIPLSGNPLFESSFIKHIDFPEVSG